MTRRLLRLAASASRPGRVRLSELRHRRKIAPVLDDRALCEAIHGGQALPRHFGVRVSERAVEYPWTLGAGLHGSVLDAGGALNHEWILSRLASSVDALTIISLGPEPAAEGDWLTYFQADLRHIPVESGTFDTVVCLSTLEHVGMDNRGYGVQAPVADDRRAEVEAVMRELARVVRPGGTVLISVPFGAPMMVGSMRQFDLETLEACINAFDDCSAETFFYCYGRIGWQRCSADEAAGRRYRDRFAEPLSQDRAVAARALACVRFTHS